MVENLFEDVEKISKRREKKRWKKKKLEEVLIAILNVPDSKSWHRRKRRKDLGSVSLRVSCFSIGEVFGLAVLGVEKDSEFVCSQESFFFNFAHPSSYRLIINLLFLSSIVSLFLSFSKCAGVGSGGLLAPCSHSR